MASLQINNPQLQAAQSKLAIAKFIGDGSMWEQAMSSLKSAYEAKKHAEDCMFPGHINLLSRLELWDAVLNHEAYGDLVSVDGDLLTAHYKINTEVSY